MRAAERYAFGTFVLERSQRRVLRSDGVVVDLTPRLFSALLMFVEQPGDLLDKDALMRALWPGLVVGENSLSQVISGLRRALGDEPQGSRYIQTVPRHGFRFVAKVSPLPAEVTQPAADSEIPLPAGGATRRPARRRWLGATLALGAAAGIGGAGWWGWRRSASVSAAGHQPTLAVLPFKPLVAEGRDELLELGMADSLIAHLSTVPGLVVRSSGSVRRYAGAEQDPLRA
ncbi:MAG TPA: transcriptional regulator, partial [Burkholderiaceae bacterium]|nr:transcriptional regulator [Burkholderiaceae bacterium]